MAMTNQEIATVTATIVAANSATSGGNAPDNVFRIASAYKEIYATVKEVDQCEQFKGPPWDYKSHRQIIEKQLQLLIQTNDLLFSKIANTPLNSHANEKLLDALNKNVATILSIVS